MASTLNNKAVSLLHEGRIPEALRLCKSAIANLRTTVNQLEQHQQGSGAFFRSSDQASWGSFEACSVVATSCKAPWQNLLASAPSPLFQVYTKAFVFRHDPAQEQHKTSWPDGGQSFQASLILYNTALMHHLLGLCTSSSRKMQIAKSLYEQAYECALRCFRRMTADQNPRMIIPSSLYLIRMACCNNLGHIHSLGMDDQRMSMCLQDIRSCLAQVEQASIDVDPLSEDYAVFLTCVLLGDAMGLPHFRTAPTA